MGETLCDLERFETIATSPAVKIVRIKNKSRK
jgi:hypothetical protein